MKDVIMLGLALCSLSLEVCLHLACDYLSFGESAGQAK